MILDEKKAVMYSRIGSRAAFGMAMLDLGKTVDDLIVLTADTSTSAGLDRFKKAFPDKFLDVGIAEQNMVGIAAGLASEGMNVVTATFAPFQTMRCCEQIKVNLGYMEHKVCLVGLASGVVLGTLGYTHCCIEDLAVMRSIPNMTVISPADCGETAKAAAAALEHPGPVYIRLTGGANSPPVYTADYDFRIGDSVTLREGGDVAIVATGTMVHAALEAATLLEQKGVSAAVVNIHTVKPIDAEAIRSLCDGVKLIVSVEEHNVVGGLGSAVAEVKATVAGAPPQLLLGIPDSFAKSGEYEDILAHYGLTAPAIAERIGEEYARLGTG